MGLNTDNRPSPDTVLHLSGKSVNQALKLDEHWLLTTDQRSSTSDGELIRDQKRASSVEVIRKQVQPVSLHTR